jgi:hypothetical protein
MHLMFSNYVLLLKTIHNAGNNADKATRNEVKAVRKPKVALTPIDYYLKEGLLALVPYYKSGYKSVVITMKSSYPDKRAVSWLLQMIATYYLQDISLIRKHYGKMLELRNSFSLAFTQHLILMPVKLRKAAAPGENTIGYVLVSEIRKIDYPPINSKDTVPWRSVIIFKNGRQLPTLNIATKLSYRKYQSSKVLEEYQRLFGINTEKQDSRLEAFLENLPNCDCLFLDTFLKEMGLEKNAANSGAENSLPAPPPRLAPEIFLKKPGIYEQRIKE